MATALSVRRALERASGREQAYGRQAAWAIDASVIDGRPAGARASAPAAGLGWVDLVLIFVFMAGLYTNYTIMLSAKVPLPSVPAGVAGLILLVRRRNDITQRALIGFCAIVTLYLASMLCAPDISWLSRRTNGLVQLTYSLAVGYGLFLTVKRADRQQISRLFLGFSLVIVVGCLLENYGGLRPISDAVRTVIYRKGVYENDLRDLLYYNRVRPKFFASEPASVTFCYTLFTFVWLVASSWRWKLPVYLALVGVGLFAMPGPTLLLMLVLLLPYMLFLASRRNGRIDAARFLVVALVAVLFSVVAVLLAKTLFAHRLEAITSGNDPSFFYRVQGPALAGLDIMSRYPFAGAGLSGEPFIEREVTNLYLRSSYYSGGWKVVSPATELLINYFWLHWIYLGFVWGVAMIAVISAWLRILGVPSVAFCWATWAVLGQASGAYVGPTCWAVLFLAAGACLLHQRAPVAAPTRWQVAPDEWPPPARPAAVA
jgi:hypothetical protein